MPQANLSPDEKAVSKGTASQTLPPLRGDAELCNVSFSPLTSIRSFTEYDKEFGFLSSFCSSFALMAYITGITGTFALAYNDGGPVMVWSNWMLASVLNLAVALCLAEISSAMPVAGGPYYWCLELTDHKPEFAILGWVNGWLNVLGQFATTAFVADILAVHVSSMWYLGNGHVFSGEEMLLAYAVVLVMAGCLSSVSTRGAKWHALFSGAFLLVAGVGVSIALLVVAPTIQPTSWAVQCYDADDVHDNNLPNLAYMYLIGMLMGQATFIGYEAPAQYSEETRNAAKNVPWAIVLSVVATALCGGLHIASLLFSVQDVATWEQANISGTLVQQVYYDAFMARYGSATGALILLVVPAVTTLNSTTISLSTNSRVLRAMARDKGVPLSRVFQALSDYTRTPVNAVWVMAALAFLLGLPLLYSSTVFSAIASISSVGLFVSYGVPILLRICKGKDFQHGPFSLGRWYLPLGVLALGWVVVSTVAFMLPVAYPMTFENFNYASITVIAAVAAICLVWYLPRYGARHACRAGQRRFDQTPSGRTLLRDKLYRQSMDYSAPRDGQRSMEDGRPVSGQLDGSTKGDSKLTLMDLIAAHKAKSSTLAPSLHLTRQCAGHKGHKRILAMRANSGASEADAVQGRKDKAVPPILDTQQQSNDSSAQAEQFRFKTRAERPQQGPVLRQRSQ